MRALELEDLLLIAEGILGVRAEELRHAMNIGSAESALAAPFASYDGVEFYADPAAKIAILGSRIVRNHPLPDGNKRLARVSMRMFASLNHFEWVERDEDRAAFMIERLAARTLSEEDFTTYIAMRLRPAYVRDHR
jgi:death-on-curing protein